mmetsp:Transcript_18975/g.55048  ORF Transcript_18975/g.55048 Transcript_18975/m.55048 type:complete len:227 (-) Transcript_18975:90-770(-)
MTAALSPWPHAPPHAPGAQHTWPRSRRKRRSQPLPTPTVRREKTKRTATIAQANSFSSSSFAATSTAARAARPRLQRPTLKRPHGVMGQLQQPVRARRQLSWQEHPRGTGRSLKRKSAATRVQRRPAMGVSRISRLTLSMELSITTSSISMSAEDATTAMAPMVRAAVPQLQRGVHGFSAPASTFAAAPVAPHCKTGSSSSTTTATGWPTTAPSAALPAISPALAC